MTPRTLLIVKTGSTVPEVARRRGDFEDWIRVGVGFAASRTRVVRVDAGEELPADPTTLAGVVVTGSSALVSEREGWSERTAEWLPSVLRAGTPLLGICYGHQLLAHGMGGRVGRNPRGREVGTVEARFADSEDALLGPLAGGVPFQSTHVESVLELPPGAELLGSTDLEPHCAFALGERAWGVQFHPEFDADIMRSYLDARAELIRGEGLDLDRIREQTRETPAGPALLARFGALARSHADGGTG